MKEKIIKSESEWRDQLTPEQFHVAREKGTEKPFTGQFHDSLENAIYICVCCRQELFASNHKFDSGTGWPSFWQPITEDSTATEQDSSFGIIRTEVLCARCNAHLGHVFSDGPPPTGLRYCINSISLSKKEV